MIPYRNGVQCSVEEAVRFQEHMAIVRKVKAIRDMENEVLVASIFKENPWVTEKRTFGAKTDDE